MKRSVTGSYRSRKASKIRSSRAKVFRRINGFLYCLHLVDEIGNFAGKYRTKASLAGGILRTL
jgi:hypothetical protein